jgi:hypothetical protein
VSIRLVAKPKILNDLPVSVHVRAPKILEESAAPSHHFQEPLTAVMILLVDPEMLGEVIDAFREERDLNSGRTGVGLVTLETLDGRCFFESH